jgi:hypothetical protein
MSILFWLSLNIALAIMFINAVMIYIKFGTWGTMITEGLNLGLALVMLVMVLKYRNRIITVNLSTSQIIVSNLMEQLNKLQDELKRQG